MENHTKPGGYDKQRAMEYNSVQMGMPRRAVPVGMGFGQEEEMGMETARRRQYAIYRRRSDVAVRMRSRELEGVDYLRSRWGLHRKSEATPDGGANQMLASTPELLARQVDYTSTKP